MITADHWPKAPTIWREGRSRVMDREPVSDRYVLGLAWTMRGEEKQALSPSQREAIQVAAKYIEASAPKAAVIRFKREFPEVFEDRRCGTCALGWRCPVDPEAQEKCWHRN